MKTKIVWPANLVEEIAYRRCVIFLGSGISATAKNSDIKSPPTWGKFIEDIKELIKSPTMEDNNFIDQMIKQEDYLMALQAIYDLSDAGSYNKYLKDTYARGGYTASETHKTIKALDSKIVITTNFDKIYDNLCNEDAYVVYDYRNTQSIIGNIKSPESLIIKAHGTIDDTSKIIFTGKQYYKAQAEYPEFYSLLHSLFLTNTVVFLGYSLSDPDINLVLQNINNTSNPACPHYVVLKEGTSKHRIKHWKDTYNIESLEFGDSYEDLQENLMELKELVENLREERSIY
ncbi:SIR2 family protein [Clostridium sp.]|uniref:SIR2 family NAD-dependent protein deacylase n=1 Tax=Clostridium sp. TaxID=1506 RepID=UPI00284511CE|nr:SIR2 family protein [Clostridium sp.]MDR3596434.1 SIR2 family protein [Clostridium sp.]